MTREQEVPRWTDRSDKTWPVDVVPAWAYDALKKENDQLRAEIARHVVARPPQDQPYTIAVDLQANASSNPSAAKTVEARHFRNLLGHYVAALDALHATYRQWNPAQRQQLANDMAAARDRLFLRLRPANERPQSASQKDLTDEDAANIGRALMERLPPDYHWSGCPTEIVTDLLNQIHDLKRGPVETTELHRLRTEMLEVNKALGLDRHNQDNALRVKTALRLRLPVEPPAHRDAPRLARDGPGAPCTPDKATELHGMVDKEPPPFESGIDGAGYGPSPKY